mmetsp:Transcript_32212/g.81108  ORF Transcript_32212/g.81108 Transcript_32212/m.81108 type:complete len:310 (-) Transcript_32212:84-1013(-)
MNPYWGNVSSSMSPIPCRCAKLSLNMLCTAPCACRYSLPRAGTPRSAAQFMNSTMPCPSLTMRKGPVPRACASLLNRCMKPGWTARGALSAAETSTVRRRTLPSGDAWLRVTTLGTYCPSRHWLPSSKQSRSSRTLRRLPAASGRAALMKPIRASTSEVCTMASRPCCLYPLVFSHGQKQSMAMLLSTTSMSCFRTSMVPMVCDDSIASLRLRTLPTPCCAAPPPPALPLLLSTSLTRTIAAAVSSSTAMVLLRRYFFPSALRSGRWNWRTNWRRCLICSLCSLCLALRIAPCEAGCGFHSMGCEEGAL